jgi:uncharacterized protein (TIGR03000 family)
MNWNTPRFRSAVVLAALAGLVALGGRMAAGEKAEKKTATIKIKVPDPSHKTTELKVQRKGAKKASLIDQEGPERTFVTKAIEPGKSVEYEFQALIEPNNYTKITRKRTVIVKAGDKITVDMTKEDKKRPDGVVIRWVPTPKDIAKKMGELAKIKPSDVVWDLGCGDGIMLITAVKELKAKKGIGIDRDPKRIREAKAAAKEAGIPDKIEIRKGDILDFDQYKDIEKANVVMLYLADQMNIRLRPNLWRRLKPGSRIVSHRFTFGDWKPDKSITVKGEDGDEYELHLWTITGKEGKK